MEDALEPEPLDVPPLGVVVDELAAAPASDDLAPLLSDDDSVAFAPPSALAPTSGLAEL